MQCRRCSHPHHRRRHRRLDLKSPQFSNLFQIFSFSTWDAHMFFIQRKNHKYFSKKKTHSEQKKHSENAYHEQNEGEKTDTQTKKYAGNKLFGMKKGTQTPLMCCFCCCAMLSQFSNLTPKSKTSHQSSRSYAYTLTHVLHLHVYIYCTYGWRKYVLIVQCHA